MWNDENASEKDNFSVIVVGEVSKLEMKVFRYWESLISYGTMKISILEFLVHPIQSIKRCNKICLES